MKSTDRVKLGLKIFKDRNVIQVQNIGQFNKEDVKNLDSVVKAGLAVKCRKSWYGLAVKKTTWILNEKSIDKVYTF